MKTFDSITPVTNIKLQVEIRPGVMIDVAAREAMELADLTKCIVEFRFNGVTCFAHPSGNPAKLIHDYHTAKEHDSHFASNEP